MPQGPPEISGPLPMTPWVDCPAISGPMAAFAEESEQFGESGADPQLTGGPARAAPSGFGPSEGAAGSAPWAGRRGGNGVAAEDEDVDDEDGWAHEDSGPIVPMGQSTRRRGNGRLRRRGRRRSAPLIALLVITAFLSGGAVVGYHFLRAYVIPPDYAGPGIGTVMVQVKQGETATDVAQTLFHDGVVASTRAFIKAAEQSPHQKALEPGFYRLHRHMKAALAFDLLLSPAARVQLRITVPEGLRVSQIVNTLNAKSGIARRDYLQALASPGTLGLPSYAKNRPEGYLFPATYSVQPRMTAADVLRSMVEQFNNVAQKVQLASTARQVNLTPAEVINVASLVQAEGGRLSDFPKIARVIYNRLNMGMKLQLDSTVMYALHTYGILANNQQLKTRSPYNTYAHAGLPPGPIDNPGEAAINAALHPARGDWLFFVTVDPKAGVTKFTSSPDVFARLRAELEKNLGQGG